MSGQIARFSNKPKISRRSTNLNRTIFKKEQDNRRRPLTKTDRVLSFLDSLLFTYIEAFSLPISTSTEPPSTFMTSLVARGHLEDYRQLFCLIIIPKPFLLSFVECYVNAHSFDVNLDAFFFMIYNIKNMISYVILKGTALRSGSVCDEGVMKWWNQVPVPIAVSINFS